MCIVVVAAERNKSNMHQWCIALVTTIAISVLVAYRETTVMMNASQELLHSMDPYGGGTPLVMDVPLHDDEREHQAMCGPRLFHRHAHDHATIEC